MNFTDIENKTDDVLLLNPVIAEIPKLTLHCHNRYLEFKNALSEYNTKELKELVKYNLDIKDYEVLNTLDSQDLKNALSAKLGNELLKRILGVSENSDPMNDPFKNLGNFSNIKNLQEELDKLTIISVTEASSKAGYYRATIGVRLFNIVIYPTAEAFKPCFQVISGLLNVKDGKLSVTADASYGVAIRYLNSPANVIEYWGEWEILLSLEKNKEIENAITDETNRAQAEEKAIRQLITDLIGESPETLDTIHEISSWILNDKSGAAAMVKLINANADAIATETERAIVAENELESEILSQVERIDNIEEKELEIVKNIENGSIIAGQAREVHSLQGKADNAEFLARTQGGGATIGNGVAEIRQISGNMVKNVYSIDSSIYADASLVTKEAKRIIVARKDSASERYGIGFVNPTYIAQPNHKYYSASLVYNAYIDSSFKIYINNYATAFTIDNGWHLLSAIISAENVVTSNNYIYCYNTKSAEFIVANHVFIDLTEMYGEGNEPTLDECDKLFATASYMPSGINVASPVTYESVGYNQCDVSKSMTKKHVFDSEIVDGANTLVVMPCLPCKLGVGENNGYIIGNGEGDEWSETATRGVFFTPFNPLETSGKLYLQQLKFNFCELCDGLHKVYLPPCAGYMVIETTSTEKLCTKFAWSGDRDYRDYEPYIKTEVKLPQSEWGLAGITACGTATRDTIDLENKKYIKRIGRVNLGELEWSKKTTTSPTGESYTFFRTYDLKGIASSATYGKRANALAANYATLKAIGLDGQEILNKSFMIYSSNAETYFRNDDYDDVSAFKAAVAGQYLYFELETPEEHDIEVSSNSYIADDYGVEKFNGSSVPIVTNLLFYIRKIVSELRNFLDKLMDGLGVSDSIAAAKAILEVIKPSNVIEE